LDRGPPSTAMESWLERLDWFTEVVGRPRAAQAKGIQSLLILVCWSLWRERNARVFYNREKHTSALISEIKDEVRLWIRAGAKCLAATVGELGSE
jgi:hypothetical protein